MNKRFIGMDIGNSYSYVYVTDKEGKPLDFISYLQNYVETVFINGKGVNLGIPSRVSVDLDKNWMIGKMAAEFDETKSIKQNSFKDLKKTIKYFEFNENDGSFYNREGAVMEIRVRNGNGICNESISSVIPIKVFFHTIIDKIIDYYKSVDAIQNDDEYYIVVGMPATESGYYGQKITRVIQSSFFDCLKSRGYTNKNSYLECGDTIIVSAGYEPVLAFHAIESNMYKEMAETINDDNKLLIVDCGGGTTDFSIISQKDGELAPILSGYISESENASCDCAGKKLDEKIKDSFDGLAYKKRRSFTNTEILLNSTERNANLKVTDFYVYNGYDSTGRMANDVVKFKCLHSESNNDTLGKTTGSIKLNNGTNRYHSALSIDVKKQDIEPKISEWANTIINKINSICSNHEEIKQALLVGASMNLKFAREYILSETRLTNVWTDDTYETNRQFLSSCVAKGALNYAQNKYQNGVSITEPGIRIPSTTDIRFRRSYKLTLVKETINSKGEGSLRYLDFFERTKEDGDCYWENNELTGDFFIPIWKVASKIDKNGTQLVVPYGQVRFKIALPEDSNFETMDCTMTVGSAINSNIASKPMDPKICNEYGYIVNMNPHYYQYCCIKKSEWDAIKKKKNWQNELDWITRPIN